VVPIEIVRLLDMVIFNVLVCNTDAHAKNYAIMIRAGAVSLAPMYDVMCGGLRVAPGCLGPRGD
jgi:serine/threonine-protein kinase HipA